MNGIHVHGIGAVSPAGWGIGSLRDALATGTPIPVKPITRPGREKPHNVRQVPPPKSRPGFMGHMRLRRTSPISQYVVGAALEAIGSDVARIASGDLRMGVVLCVMSGCVNYSRRFYDETLRDPATASPLVFPETVFNAPASHLATVLGTPEMNYTLVGDPGTFVQGMALAAQWLEEERVEACIIVAGEECDWLTSDAFHLFSRSVILSDGAGALYLKKDAGENSLAELKCVTDSQPFTQSQDRARAAQRVREELPSDGEGALLVDGLQNLPGSDSAETGAWRDWRGARVSPKTVLGEGLMAAAAWQCVAAIDALDQNRYTAANVSVVGCNQQAIAARFEKVAS
jgi:3-oxoacyl-(acyl-carrier-protein) synthase